MKKITFLLFAFFCALAIAAQTTIINDGNAEKRAVTNFHAIKVSSSIDLFLNQGNEEGVAVSASEEEYRNRIKTEVTDGILNIWFDGKGMNWGWGGKNKKLRVYVSAKTLRGLAASGACDVIVSGTLQLDAMEMYFSGASDFKGTVSANRLKINISGASDVTIQGKVESLSIKASGASNFRGYELAANECEASASGASDVEVNVNKALNASATGASDIHAKGEGVIKNKSTSGASSIKKI
jgi:hypothetical protein